jgi:hypothetical protein
MKKRIHINQHKIRSNNTHNTREPVIAVRTYKKVHYGDNVKIKGDSEVIYSPNKPLSCGARVWIETTSDIEIKQGDKNVHI